MAFTFNPPEQLDTKLTEEASANRRSKQQQLILILEERYDPQASQEKPETEPRDRKKAA